MSYSFAGTDAAGNDHWSFVEQDFREPVGKCYYCGRELYAARKHDGKLFCCPDEDYPDCLDAMYSQCDLCGKRAASMLDRVGVCAECLVSPEELYPLRIDAAMNSALAQLEAA